MRKEQGQHQANDPREINDLGMNEFVKCALCNQDVVMGFDRNRVKRELSLEQGYWIFCGDKAYRNGNVAAYGKQER